MTAQGEEKFVFWSYDQYPFTLGCMASPRPNGMWYVSSYQMTVKPIAVFEPLIGKGIKNELKALEIQRAAAIDAMNAGFNARVREFAPFIARTT